MMGKLLRGASALFIYFCIATIIAQAIGIGTLLYLGRLDGQRVAQILALAQGMDLVALAERDEPDLVVESSEQISFAAVEEQRALRLRGMELRMVALQKGVDRVRLEQEQLTDERALVSRLRDEFFQMLAEREDASIVAGMQDVRRVWEKIRPQQAKELILQMVDAGELEIVVQMFRDMSLSKKARIVGEFKTAEERAQLEVILQNIIEGEPQTGLISQTRDDLEQAEQQQR